MSRATFRLWITVNSLIVVAFAVWILQPAATAPPPEHRITPGLALPSATLGPPTLTKEDVLAIDGLRFGLSAPDVPWSSERLGQLATTAGADPTIIQIFTRWTERYPAAAVELSYQRGALPMLSWEPWAGSAYGERQPRYALGRILDGEFDEYITTFAADVREHGWPVAIRFAHEMNGHWYPWSEQSPDNEEGQYVAVWRYVWNLFDAAGAHNVIWVWSPNILRPVPNVALEPLYPGDRYVDWVGLTGYAVDETTAAEVFGPTLDALRAFTDKPLLITETGAQPSAHKAAWIEDFFTWLGKTPGVVGFVWFEYRPDEGSSADWRFSATPETIEAFQAGIRGADLADTLPTAGLVTPEPTEDRAGRRRGPAARRRVGPVRRRP